MSNREEILAKSRNENKDKDLFEKEVMLKAGNISACTATILATIFFIIQMMVGSGRNYGFYAISLAVLASGYIVKSIHLKRNSDIVTAVILTVISLAFSAIHLYVLFSSSNIL